MPFPRKPAWPHHWVPSVLKMVCSFYDFYIYSLSAAAIEVISPFNWPQLDFCWWSYSTYSVLLLLAFWFLFGHLLFQWLLVSYFPEDQKGYTFFLNKYFANLCQFYISGIIFMFLSELLHYASSLMNGKIFTCCKFQSYVHLKLQCWGMTPPFQHAVSNGYLWK